MIRVLMSLLVVTWASALLASPAAAQGEVTPLFADDGIVRLTIRGPLGPIARGAARVTDPHPASLTLDGASPETHAIQLSARGITRRRRDICTFPPLRIEFAERPAAPSLFAGQRRLKLVTHCQSAEAFQQYLLLEYATYRLLNAVTPLSLRVRLARIDYVEAGSNEVLASRLGFLIEDVDDAARRNGLVEIEGGNFPPARLSPPDAARFAVFQYMIGNLDWAMEAGPAGDDCCHNSKPLASAATAVSGLIPIPYDFDHAGLVDAPYATPPQQISLPNVRVRRYRGFCAHNAEARAAAAELLAARARLESVLVATPELDERSRSRAIADLASFFDEVATPADVEANLLRACLR